MGKLAAVDLWILQAALTRGRRPDRARRSETSLDSLVRGEARATDEDEGLDPALAFTMRIARALISWGTPAHRVEDALERLADALHFDIEVMSMPTALVVTLSDGESVRTRLVRVEPGGMDLERLSALQELVGRVERHELAPGDAARRVEAILARPARYGAVATALSYGLVSTSATVLLGGGALDVPAGALLGVLVGVLDALSARFAGIGRLLPALAAMIVSFLASLAASSGLAVQPSVLLLSAIIVLLPGFTVTTATMELATANLVAGTARLAAGATTFLQLGFGVALGHRIAQLLPAVDAATVASLAPATALAAPLLSALGFAVLLRVRPSDFGWVLLSVTLALAGSRLGGTLLDAELGAFVGAALVASAAHAFSRAYDRPISVMLVPGILFLVPGSVGFLSVSSLLANDVEGAVGTAFRMFLVAMALAAGVLVATAAVPPRRSI